MENNYYEILEISQNASPDVIEAVYKRLAKKYHPDLQLEMNRASAEAKMKLLNLAYSTLKNPLTRKEYDNFLMKKIKNSNIETGRNAVAKIDLIKASFNKFDLSKLNHRTVVSTALALLFGTIVTVLGVSSNKKADVTPDIVWAGEKITKVQASPGQEYVSKDKSAVPKDRFTLGSSQADVQEVMGVPTSMFLYSWGYGASLVYFDKDGKVDGWVKIDNNLKAWLGYINANAPAFKIGSTKAQVIKAMGTPTSVIGGVWSYGKSTVSFDERGQVKDWIEVDKRLKVMKEPGKNIWD